MKCQLGIYRSRETALDQWDSLIYLDSERTPRNILRDLTPFLRAFHARRGMNKADSLAAWLTWNLIHRGLVAGDQSNFSGISLGQEIRGDIDFFYRISPGLVTCLLRISCTQITPRFSLTYAPGCSIVRDVISPQEMRGSRTRYLTSE